MVYIDPQQLGWRPYVHTWLKTKMDSKLNETNKNYILDLFDAYVEDGIRFRGSSLFKQLFNNLYIGLWRRT